MRAFELRPAGCAVQNAEFTQLVWGSKEELSDSVISNIGPWLEDIGTASNTAIDLVRLAAAAYMADRQTRRGEGYSRTIRIHVQVTDAAPWLAVLDDLVGLLHWLTADIWEISVAPDGRERPEAVDALAEPPEIVSLLSGGLDSMAGALAAPRETRRLFVGHWDNPTVKASQDRTWNWLKGVLTEDCAYRQVRLCEAASKQETSTRSRCLLFFALAVGIASARGSGEVEVPENGFTSLNPALGNNRGGVLSTRSTHPWTISQFQQILDKLGIGVRVSNPYELLTKGELVARANESISISEGVPLTLSCGKLDGRIYKGGNPNHHCGLCIACLTRRGALLSSGVRDETPYLFKTLDRNESSRLLSRRGGDLRAVRAGIARDIDEFALLAQGPYPEDYDLTSAAEIYRRGIAELAKALPA